MLWRVNPLRILINQVTEFRELIQGRLRLDVRMKDFVEEALRGLLVYTKKVKDRNGHNLYQRSHSSVIGETDPTQ